MLAAQTAAVAGRSVLLGHQEDDGVPVLLDVDRLIHMLLAASTGGGKSSGLRTLIERSHGLLPLFIIDVEGEFVTLRELFDDFVIVGPGGDLEVDENGARLLARRALETRANFILDLSEVPEVERHQIVRGLAEGFLDAPRAIWNDLLLIVDEAQKFVPQKEKRGSVSVAKDTLTDLASRARKRGIRIIWATQRLAKIDNDAIGECQDRLIGRMNLADDRERAVSELAVRKGERGDTVHTLARLRPGSFCGAGVALGLDEAVVVKLDLPKTSPPPRGAGSRAAPPPKGRVLEILADLRDLPRRAEEEARTLEAALVQVRKLEKDLAEARRAAPPGADAEDLRRLRDEYVAAIRRAGATEQAAAERELAWRMYATDVQALVETITVGAARLTQPDNGATPTVILTPAVAKDAAAFAKLDRDTAEVYARRAVPAAILGQPRPAAPRAPSGGLRPREQQVLDVVAEWARLGHPRPSVEQVAALMGLSPTSGGFKNLLGGLRSAGLLEAAAGDGTVSLGRDGKAKARATAAPRSTQEMRDRVAAHMRPREAEVLDIVLRAYPRSISKDQLAERMGLSVTSGGFKNLLGRLRNSLCVITYPEPATVRAADWLIVKEGSA